MDAYNKSIQHRIGPGGIRCLCCKLPISKAKVNRIKRANFKRETFKIINETTQP